MGCSNFSSIYLIPVPKTYVERPSSIRLGYSEDPGWWDYETLGAIRQQIETYLKLNTSVNPEIQGALRRLEVRKGMSEEQVQVVLGPPSNRRVTDEQIDVWTYKKPTWGVRRWYSGWGKLYFRDGTLVDIEVQHKEYPSK